jgi:S1-C subfamily serine protease
MRTYFAVMILFFSTCLVAQNSDYRIGKPALCFGIGFDPISKAIKQKYSLSEDYGLFITYTEVESPASYTELEAGDVIVEFNGHKVTDNNSYLYALNKLEVGLDFEFKFMRGENLVSSKGKAGQLQGHGECGRGI